MRKEKFKYNPETLSYEKVEIGWGERLVKVSLVVAPAIVLSLVFQIILLSSGWFQSTREKELERDNAFLNAQLDVMRKDVSTAIAVLNDISKRDNEIYRSVFNAERFPSDLREMGTGGSDEYEQLTGFQSSQKVIENTKKIKELEGKLYAQSIFSLHTLPQCHSPLRRLVYPYLL